MMQPPPTALPRRGVLADRFPHPRDQRVLFDPAPHKYYVKWCDAVDAPWEPADRSVTAIVHAPFDEFDSKLTIARMQRSTKPWKPEYHNSDGSRKSREELELFWKLLGEDASAQGTLMHATFENYLNATALLKMENPPRGIWIDIDDPDLTADERKEIVDRALIMYQVARRDALFRNAPRLITIPGELQKEVNMFLRYHAERPIRAFATEISLFGFLGGVRVVGQADLIELLRIDHDKRVLHLAIGDFKRTKEIKTNAQNGYGKGPVACMVNQNYSHFTLQVNVYRLLMETYYREWTIDGIVYTTQIDELYILVCHPNRADALRIDIPRLQDQVILDVITYSPEHVPPTARAPKPRESKENLKALFDE